jgi:hypothetical protein
MDRRMHIRVFFATTFCCFSFLFAGAQLQPYNSAIIWRGFDHAWTYNHRCNRLGDFVTGNEGKPQTTHVSATGIGADSTYFNSYYTTVTTPDMVFKEGCAHIKIRSVEKELAEGSEVISIPCEEWLRKKSYTSLLNGFALRSKGAPDKIQLMRLQVEDPIYIEGSNTLNLKINYSFVFNCQSAECPEFRKGKVSYDLDIYYLVAGFENTTAHAAEFFFSRSYAWNKKDDVNELPEQRDLCGVGNNKFEKAFAGIKSFSLVLNEAHWLCGWDNNISPASYDMAAGCADLSVDLLFKEWQPGMKKNSASPSQSQFSSKRSGWAALDAEVLFIQVRNAAINNGNQSGKMFWKGKKRSPDMQAVTTIAVPLE